MLISQLVRPLPWRAYRGVSKIRSSNGAASEQDFREIFADERYPRYMLLGAKTVVDIGAGAGLFSYFARLHATRTARIFTMEADRDAYATLNRNMRDLNVCTFCRDISSKEPLSPFFAANQIVVVDFLRINLIGLDNAAILDDHDLWATYTIGTLAISVDRSTAGYADLLAWMQDHFESATESSSLLICTRPKRPMAQSRPDR